MEGKTELVTPSTFLQKDNKLKTGLARLHSKISTAVGPEKPIDLLLRYVGLGGKTEVAGMDMPYHLLEGLGLKELEELRRDIEVYKKLETSDKGEFWKDMAIIVGGKLRKLSRSEHSTQAETHVSNEESLISMLNVLMARARLCENHQTRVNKLQQMKERTTNGNALNGETNGFPSPPSRTAPRSPNEVEEEKAEIRAMVLELINKCNNIQHVEESAMRESSPTVEKVGLISKEKQVEVDDCDLSSKENTNESGKFFLPQPDLIAKHGYPVETHGDIRRVHARHPPDPPWFERTRQGTPDPRPPPTRPSLLLGRLARQRTRKGTRWHEMGKFDLPAILDAMTEKTGQEKLLMHPVSYPCHYKTQESLVAGLMSTAKDRYVPYPGHRSQLVYRSHIGIFAPFVNPVQAVLDVLLCHTPAGTSAQNIVHFAQEVYAKKFQQYDWGKAKNLKRYGSIEPPEYDLSKVITPTFLYWGKNDSLADPTDVEWLSNRLPASCLIGCYPVDFTDWNHLDFLYGEDAKKLVYDKMLNKMKLKIDT
ncbi:unnamed protein product [Darwinula stevensoni]|uniref:Splicing factor cactin central domain-containing protein n=1 Tax=Darwinula stevensoni TaxID=69355 RepID=A0A7R9ADC0_9CRUS|nr:unnamed protein product [Darwinula stevensoni]CAG0900961.1 unnamed protein product [Darwinula stevensoni]